MEALILFASIEAVVDFLFTNGKVDGDDFVRTEDFGRVGIGPANSSLSINLISSKQFMLWCGLVEEEADEEYRW